MSVSVVTTTVSFGGLDMLFNSMSWQSKAVPFEIVLADEWYGERKDLLAERLRNEYAGLSVKHIPIPKKQNFIDHCNGWNTGLRAAEGELVCFLNDYFWAYPDYIRDHWEVYTRTRGYSMIGYCDRFAYPPLATEDTWTWWTAFAEEMTAARAQDYFSHTAPFYQERKGGTFKAGDPVPGHLFYASLNESIPLAVLKALNGWDERYDGGYASNDVDLGVRANMIGWRFVLNPTINFKIGQASMPRHMRTVVKPHHRSPQENHQRFLNRIEAISQGREPLRVPAGWGAFE
jgi:hypothetical protein